MTNKDFSKLLLLSCSQRKRLDKGLLPAIDRYDGPAYRVLRKYLRQDSIIPVDVRILSAKYGLISASYFLPYYDFRMTKKQSERLHYQTILELEAALNSQNYADLLICLGKNYIEAIRGYQSIVPDGLSVQVAMGGLGRKLSILHDWLYGNSSKLQKNRSMASVKEMVCLRGVKVNLTSEQVLDIARRAISEREPKATHCQSWYVLVDNQRVAPKWLVSQITGLPVSNFVTEDACRVLTHLGLEVKRL